MLELVLVVLAKIMLQCAFCSYYETGLFSREVFSGSICGFVSFHFILIESFLFFCSPNRNFLFKQGIYC